MILYQSVYIVDDIEGNVNYDHFVCKNKIMFLLIDLKQFITS